VVIYSPVDRVSVGGIVVFSVIFYIEKVGNKTRVIRIVAIMDRNHPAFLFRNRFFAFFERDDTLVFLGKDG